MITPPSCRWRRPLPQADRFACRSPKIRAPHGVTAAICAGCILCNHPRVPWRAWLRHTIRQEIPRYVRLGWTFTRAIARHVAHGLPLASPADQSARRAICSKCWRRDPKTDSCTLCGCKLGVSGKSKLREKIAWAAEKCPEWDPEKRPGQYWGPVEGEKIWSRLWRAIFAYARR